MATYDAAHQAHHSRSLAVLCKGGWGRTRGCQLESRWKRCCVLGGVTHIADLQRKQKGPSRPSVTECRCPDS